MKERLDKFREKIFSRWWLALIVIFFTVLVVLAAIIGAFEVNAAGKFYPGVYIGYFNLSGRTPVEARELLQSQVDQVLKNGLEFHHKQKLVTIEPIITSTSDPDLSHEILSFDLDATINRAYNIGRSGNVLDRVMAQLKGLIGKKTVSINYELSEAELIEILKSNFNEYREPAVDAKIVIEPNTFNIAGQANKYQASVIPEKSGYDFDYVEAVKQLRYNLENLLLAPIEIVSVVDIPEVVVKDIKGVTTVVNETINSLRPITLVDNYSVITAGTDKKNWTISTAEIIDLMVLKTVNKQTSLGLDHDKLKKRLENIASEINVPASNAKFVIENGKVLEFQGSAAGIKLDEEASSVKIERDFFTAINSTNNITAAATEPVVIDLEIVAVSPEVVTENVNNLGIKELIGIGRSNFSGSPANRIHNLKNGAARLNGILIKPGEEFSTGAALGEITAETGYLEEWVIKGDKTVKEYGGGLCQVATTMFRVAMNAGLPITERHQHAYNVPYYFENGVTGVDAAIYTPTVDIKFINNTANYILIQTRSEGVNLIFEFWGAKDGRKVVRTQPKVYNWIPAPATKYVETEELAPGKKKCTEGVHAGVTAEFNYQVEYPSGEIKEQFFKSVYKPWGTVCLIGIDPVKINNPENTNVSNDLVNSNINTTNSTTKVNSSINSNPKVNEVLEIGG